MSTTKRRSPLVIAHRGASAVRPENTVAAFRQAAELGADWVELDVRRTADQVLVVHHDAALPDGRVIVEHPAADLPASVPTLDAALDACAGMGVNVEIKNDPGDPDHDPLGGQAAAVGELLSGCPQPGLEQLLVSSFDTEVIRRMREQHPEVRCGALVVRLGRVGPLVGELADQGVVAINPWDALVDADLVHEAHRAGLAVNVWTVDDPDRMAQLVELGVDGIITNTPDVARSVVDGTR